MDLAASTDYHKVGHTADMDLGMAGKMDKLGKENRVARSAEGYNPDLFVPNMIRTGHIHPDKESFDHRPETVDYIQKDKAPARFAGFGHLYCRRGQLRPSRLERSSS